ncbi:MAG: hypothetical protein AAGG75_28605 [Bacteroidota bacterium]
MSSTQSPDQLYSFEDVIREEDKQLLLRRQRLHGDQETEETLQKSKFGIALSGGGIRSATINLGILKTLNLFGLLRRADYLSTVSGGGYTGAYVQATLKKEGEEKALFQDEHIEYMRNRGEYMLPGKGLLKTWNLLVLITAYLISLLMSWISPVIMLLLFYIGYSIISKLFKFAAWTSIQDSISQIPVYEYALYTLSGVFVLHFILNLMAKYNVGISVKFNRIESGLALIGILWLFVQMVTGLRNQELLLPDSVVQNLLLAVAIFILGYFANPNALSFHRFYRNQLVDAFLNFTGEYRNVKLGELFNPKSDREGDYLAPYPLINTCLNLQASNDKRFKGSKANDYFLLSPLYSGAKLSTYVPTADTADYKEMTLPAATTISAAAVNPGMGMYSNKVLSILMTLLNARLGFWINNPRKSNKSGLVWWPFYFIYELFSWIGTDHYKLNISDGGHIENLGVYELLRRRCRLIIAVDAGADPKYDFGDLENLTVRARNELGLAINFRAGEHPEEVIRPKPSHGYSDKRYAIADVFQLWEELMLRNDEGQLIKDRSGKEVEVLINYKKLREKLRRLDDYNLQALCDALDKVGSEQLRNQQQLEAAAQQLDPFIRIIFEQLLDIFQDIRKVEQKLVSKADQDAAMRYVIKNINERIKTRLKVGTLVYVKSSIVAPRSKLQIMDRDSLDYQTYKYKVYHPNFPHEPTSDQFFDQVQWESYYRLGQYIAGDVLGTSKLPSYFDGSLAPPRFSIEELICRFDEDKDLFEQVAAAPEVFASAPPMGSVRAKAKAIEVPPVEATSAPAAAEEEANSTEQKIVIGGKDEYTM